ncbi:MAG: OmpA family protein [Spirochaeta sp.]|nr:OmpA family protein [Spirochaeta sp.]
MVTYVEGDADGRSGTSGQWDRLAAGDKLDRLSVIRTYPGSYLDLRLQTGTVVRVMEETLFSLSNLGSERIEVDIREGEVISRVKRLAGKQEFFVQTPGAVAGVRGTELVLAVDPEQTAVFGMSGSVEVSNPDFPDQTTTLGVHERSTVSSGVAPTDPQPMTPEEIDRYQRILDTLNEEQVLLVSDQITFQPNSAELTPGAQEALDEIYDQLRSVESRIEILGHTADIGSPQSQVRLSTERAESVRDYLIERGISESQLSATGMGGSRPLSEDTDPAALRRNRRVEFRVNSD